jgi:hypothetical protein
MKKVYTNEALVKRNSRIARITMLGGLLVLAAGMFISFQMPDQFALSLGALLFGFVLSQIGIYFTNRWGRRPRLDELLNQGLKGLDERFKLYHYLKPASHILVGPAGVWVLVPYYQRGTIRYSNGRWRQVGGGLFRTYMKIFAQEGIGRPDLEIAAEIEGLKSYLQSKLPEGEVPPVYGALVFTHPDAIIDIDPEDNPPAETVHLSKLKDMIRKRAKEKALSMEKALTIQDAIEEAIV